MHDIKGFVTDTSLDDFNSSNLCRSPSSTDDSPHHVVESNLLGNNFIQVMQDLLSFDSRLPRTFSNFNGIYKLTCGKTACNFTCGVPHITLVVRIRGTSDDQIGIVCQSVDRAFGNMLPKGPNRQHDCDTWRRSRWHILRRIFLCLVEYYLHGDMQRIYRLASKPLHRHHVQGRMLGKVLDFQKQFLMQQTRMDSRTSEKTPKPQVSIMTGF